jgi:hypothetical protein
MATTCSRARRVQRFGDHEKAIEEALMTTGRAIMFTGTTLTVSVIFDFLSDEVSRDGDFTDGAVVLPRGGALAFIPGWCRCSNRAFAAQQSDNPHAILHLIRRALYYFDYANLSTLGLLAVIVGVGETSLCDQTEHRHGARG